MCVVHSVIEIFFIAALWFLIPVQYAIVPKVFALIFIPWIIAEKRIAVVFTRDRVVYRPMLGAPRSIKFEHISEIRKARVPRLVAGNFAGFRQGIALRLLGGETVVWRLPLPEPENIIEQLSRLTGKPVKIG